MKCRADSDHIVEPILKYILVLFNFFSFVISVGFIVGGAWLLYQRDKITNSRNNLESVFDITTDLGGYLIAVGTIGIIFSVIGIAATIRENIKILKLYMIILLVILVLNLVVGVVFLIYSGQITTKIIQKLSTAYVTNYYEDDEAKSLLDVLQSQYSCCGIQGYKDWEANPYHSCNSTNTKSALACLVPSSCCKQFSTDQISTNLFCSKQVLKDESLTSNINVDGCRKAIIQLAQYGVKILSGILVGVTIILAIIIILLQYLIILIRKEQALFNAKNRYVTLDEDDDTMNYIN